MHVMKRKALLVLIPVLWVSVFSHAQLWSGIVSPTRAVDWANAGIPGGIPNRTTICSTLSPGATAAQINSAISSCSNGVVLLASGTYNLSASLRLANNVTLRGQGADQTFLVFSGGVCNSGIGGAICMEGANSGINAENNVCDWTAGYAPGTTVITLANCGTTAPAHGSLANLKVGSLLILDQVNELNDTGTVWNCAETSGNSAGAAVCANTVQGGNCRTDGPSVSGETQRCQQQGVIVQAINGNQITISPGVYMPNWRTGQAPQAFFANSYITSTGVENLSIDGTSVGSHNITVLNATSCWVRGVRSLYANRSHIMLAEASHCVVRDNYSYQNQSHASVSYGIELQDAFDSLVENNISQQVTDSTPSCTGGCEGNVFSYNLGIDEAFAGAGFFQASFYMHSAGDAMNLLEGNIGTGFTADDVHGTHHFNTLFRNYLPGWQSSCFGSPCVTNTTPVWLQAGSRYMNLVGNVLGHTGYHNTYQCATITTDGCPNGNTSIFNLGNTGGVGFGNTSVNGFCLQPGCTSHGDYDPQTISTLMRWGNYDVVTGVRWCGSSSDTGWSTTCGSASEIPTTLASFSNPVPTLGDTGAGQSAMPASFYYTIKPNWFGSVAWPPIGPEVTGGNLASLGGHANMNPAMSCFINTMGAPADGSGPVLSFNADTCYGSNPAPAPPTGLTVTVF